MTTQTTPSSAQGTAFTLAAAMPTLQRIGVLGHPARPATIPITHHIAGLLHGHGMQVWAFDDWTPDRVRPHLIGTDLVIAIGGDGAMLRASQVCAPLNVPLLGVNMGYLGFLTEIKAIGEVEAGLASLFAGAWWVETRMMIEAQAYRDKVQIAATHALNDVVVSRGAEPRMIRLDAYIDGGWTTSYNADALILATPTGSTAYALACGGPILPPELRTLMMLPVAPHLSLDRPIVLPEGARVEVIVAADGPHEIALSADGVRVCDLHADDRIVVQASPFVSRFVRLRERTYFYRSLLDRLEPRIPTPTRRSTAYPPPAAD